MGDLPGVGRSREEEKREKRGEKEQKGPRNPFKTGLNPHNPGFSSQKGKAAQDLEAHKRSILAKGATTCLKTGLNLS